MGEYTLHCRTFDCVTLHCMLGSSCQMPALDTSFFDCHFSFRTHTFRATSTNKKKLNNFPFFFPTPWTTKYEMVARGEWKGVWKCQPNWKKNSTAHPFLSWNKGTTIFFSFYPPRQLSGARVPLFLLFLCLSSSIFGSVRCRSGSFEENYGFMNNSMPNWVHNINPLSSKRHFT